MMEDVTPSSARFSTDKMLENSPLTPRYAAERV